MSRKKAYAEDLRSPHVQRISKYYLQFFKGTFYQKILTGKSYVHFAYGCYSAPKPYPLVFHQGLDLLYVRHGPGAYYIAGKLYPFQKRLLLIAKPKDICALMSVPLKEKAEFGSLTIPLGWLGMDLDVKSWPHQLLLSEDEAARFEMVCGQICAEVKNKESGYEDMIRLKFQEICGLVRRIVSQPQKERVHPLVDQLREYINRHFTEKTSLLDIGRGFGYTAGYLEVAFKKITGLSLKRYILQRRIIEARILLETNPELKLATVADQVGFEDYRLFHRIFKILTGVNPASYRSVIKKAAAKTDKAGRVLQINTMGH